MDRVAIFVDAAYLYAQGSVALTGTKQARQLLSLNDAAVISELTSVATAKTPNLPLLRIYWYDGVSYRGPTAEQTHLAHTDNVKVRLGLVNSAGQQKGVDSLIVIDLLDLARNHAMSDAILLSGDEDVRIGVQMAQNCGVRVHLLGIAPMRGSQSKQLLQEADTTTEWDKKTITKFLSLRPVMPLSPAVAVAAAQQPAAKDLPPMVAATKPAASAKVVAPTQAAAPNPLEAVVTELVATLTEGDIASIDTYWKGQRGVPLEFDGKLLARGRVALGRDLDTSEKRRVRVLFTAAVRAKI